MAFGVCELPAIPKERGKLQAAINEWHHQRKQYKLLRFAVLNVGFWFLYILFVWAPGYRAEAAPVVDAPIQVVPAPVDAADLSEWVYLPLIVRE
jgi:hypothetical protein